MKSFAPKPWVVPQPVLIIGTKSEPTMVFLVANATVNSPPFFRLSVVT